MKLNDRSPYLAERDNLLAQLVDDGTISAADAQDERCRERGTCSESNCEQPIDGACDVCGVTLCTDGLYMHEVMGCDVARTWNERSGGDGDNYPIG